MKDKDKQEKQQKLKKRKKQMTSIAKYSALAFQMLAIILVFVFIGVKLDAYFQTSFRWFTLIGTILGFVLSLYHSLKDFLKL